eukprot:GILJ01004427.1.p1 GENE.GILJ01004427.1~~GILJ01004427.1.p1  ORF type:complete len:230 (-),score=33.37 GILJ01004427.1:330-1019(-)
MASVELEQTLQAIRSRADDLRNCIMSFKFHDHAQWTALLDHYKVVSAQLLSLNAELRPLLEHFVLLPDGLVHQDPLLVPNLLSTKMLPEMEEKEAEVLSAFHTQRDVIFGAAYVETEENSKMAAGDMTDDQKDALKTRVEGFNTMVDGLGDHLTSLRENLALRQRFITAPPQPLDARHLANVLSKGIELRPGIESKVAQRFAPAPWGSTQQSAAHPQTAAGVYGQYQST